MGVGVGVGVGVDGNIFPFPCLQTRGLKKT